MSPANVRCAGKRFPGMGGLLGKQEWPCEPRWKGKRKTRIYAPITFTYTSGHKDVEDRWLAVDPTTKPCPRCGGRVELIPEVER